MKLHRFFISPFLAGALLAFPIKALAHDDLARPMDPGNSAFEGRTPEMPSDELAQQPNPAEPFAAPFDVAITYCHVGSTVDPSTGEIIDLYVLCEDPENLQIA